MKTLSRRAERQRLLGRLRSLAKFQTDQRACLATDDAHLIRERLHDHYPKATVRRRSAALVAAEVGYLNGDAIPVVRCEY